MSDKYPFLKEYLKEYNVHILELEQYIINNPYVKSFVILYEGLLFWKYGKELDEEMIMKVIDVINKIEIGRWIEIDIKESNDVVLAKRVDNNFSIISIADNRVSEALKEIVDKALLRRVPKCKKCGADLYKAVIKCPYCNKMIIAGMECPYCGYKGIRKCPTCGSNILPSGEVVTRFKRKILLSGIMVSIVTALILFPINPLASIVATASIIYATIIVSVRG